MTPKHIFILLLALTTSTLAQSDDELHIPDETDNQFPPDNHSEPEVNEAEGSGAGVIVEPLATTTELTLPPILEDIQLQSFLPDLLTPVVEERTCPKPCVCNIEGDSDKFVVDCSGYELTELPKPLDAKTTDLNLQNNKLTQISKDISDLKNLKTLNVNNNDIMELVSGSISELPELRSLKLGNNRLIEYPQDLKNSFGLTKLEELDLGGNDMRTDIKPEIFSNFISLRKLILPTSSSDLVQDLCATLKKSLETVCTGSCNEKAFDCPSAPRSTEDDLLDFVLPGFIALSIGPGDNSDHVPLDKVPEPVAAKDDVKPLNVETTVSTPVETTSTTSNVTSDAEFSLRSAVDKAAVVESSPNLGNTASEANNADADVTVGAASEGKKGGVDKSVIGIIVAGMVVVVAGITIKKNWSSIKNRFNSSPRTANDRVGATTNGTSPEEVPLQEKSPV